MAATTICSDFGASPNKVSHYFHSFPTRRSSDLLCRQSNVSGFNMPSRLVITFLSQSKHLLISWLQPLSAVILEPKKIKPITVSIFSPSICHEVMGQDTMIFIFWMLSFKPAFHSPLSPSSRGSSLGWYHLHIWGYWYFPKQFDFSLCFIQPRISYDVLCI